MNHRERILAALGGQMVDCLPWAPRIDLWYDAHRKQGTLPARYAGWSMWDILRDMGAALYSNQIELFSTRLHDVDVVTQTRGFETHYQYQTPFGVVSCTLKSTAQLDAMGIQPYESEHLIKSVDDFPAIEYLIEHTELVPEHERVQALMDEFGGDGVVMASTGYSAPNKLVRELMGYDRAFYHIADHPREFERLLAAMEAQGDRLMEIAADSPARIILIDQNLIDSVPGTRLFRRYFLPYLKRNSDYLHSRGKLTAAHVDGDMRALFGAFAETGIDVAEAVTPAPMCNYTLAEARQAWSGSVVIWGGVPTTVLCPSTVGQSEFESFIDRLFLEIRPGDRFVLGLGDNLPTDGSLARLAHITSEVGRRGTLPLE